MWVYLFLSVLVVGSRAENATKFICPALNGSFPDSIQCDKYYECKNGTAEEVLCSDGLAFNMNLTRTGKCDQRFNVDCGKRIKFQKPIRISEFCPRRNGVFPHPDDTICDIFFICDDGIHSETKCANGLHFEESTGQCTWPDVANRPNCEEQKRKLKDGFVCPKEPKTDASGQIIVNPHYPHPDDCQYFYVCVNGVEPRELMCTCDGCDDKKVYNDKKKACDSPSEVPGCEDWFN